MCLRLQKYYVKITYRKGSQLVIADALSCSYLTNEQADCSTEDGDKFCAMLEEISLVADLPISNERIGEIRCATVADPVLQKVREYVEKGWSTSGYICHLVLFLIIPFKVKSTFSFF